MSLSINKATRIKVVSSSTSTSASTSTSSSNESIKVLPNTILNYTNDYDAFIKMLSISIRLRPEDPHYTINKIMHKTVNDNKMIELTANNIKKFIEENVSSLQFSDKKLSIIVHVDNDISNDTIVNKIDKRNPSPIRYKSPVVSRNVSPVPNRSRISSSPLRDSSQSFTPKRGGPQQSPLKRPLTAPTTTTPKVSRSKQNEIVQSNDDDEFSSLINSKGHYSKDGRPSIGTMQAQWEFMKEQFVSNNNEELEWQMIKNRKKKGQYQFCKKKYDQSEDDYFKSLADIELYEEKCKLLVGQNAVLTQSISSIAATHETYKIYGNSDEADTNVKAAQSILSKCLEDEKLLKVFDEESVKLLTLIADLDTTKRAATLAASFQTTHMNGLIQSLTNELSKAKKKEQSSCDSMELWSKRQKEAADYLQALYEEEQEWKQKEKAKNEEAIQLMRSLVPTSIGVMSITDLMTAYKENGSLITLELATEFKNNKLLQLVQMHVDDIKSLNFLMGQSKQYFENLECLDIIELRAIAIVLPDKFDFDQTGMKLAWRQRFFERVKLLVSQENGDEVKSTYDHATGQRRLVKLPPLTNDNKRRQIYYYKQHSVCLQQLQKYEEKETLLKKKEAWLQKATTEALDMKKEYDIILNEMRDPAFKGKYDYSSVKDQAKKMYFDAENNRKNLSFEVTRLMTAIANNPISKEEFLKSIDDVEKYFIERGNDWKSTASSSSVLIEGPFDPTPELFKTLKDTIKCSSSEEDAAIRKLELSAFKPPDTLPSVSESEVHSPLPCEVKSTGSMIKQRQASILDASSSSSSSSSAAASITPKKVAVNPDMLNVLNKMFSPVPSNSTSSLTPKRVTVTNNNTDANKENDNSNKEKNTNNENKTTQSKLLQKLVHSNDVEPLPQVSKSKGLSFLDAIKARKVAE